MAIKINDRFWIERDKWQWVLVEWTQGQTKNGEPKLNRRENYYPKLGQVCMEIIERSPADAVTLKDLIETIHFVKVQIMDAVSRYDGPVSA